MGSTPVFGWPYPDPSDLVRDAPTAFEALGTAIEGVVDGAIIQVVAASSTAVVTNSTNTYTDTGVTATITPRGTASRIVAMANHMVVSNASTDYVGIQMLRGTAVVFTPVTNATGPYDVGSEGTFYVRVPLMVVDSPATSSATTYKTQFRRYANAGTAAINGDGFQTTPSTSTIVLMEVAS